MENFVDVIKKLEKNSAALERIRERQRIYNKVYYAKPEKQQRLKQRHECGCGLHYIGNNKKNHEIGRIHKMWVNWKAENVKEEIKE